jgi:putative ABC transport system substrate-binding protein
MHFHHWKRREIITLLSGAATWPLAARAQQPERMRRIGVLHTPAADDPVGQARNAAFLQGLEQLGWTDGPQRADRNSLACRRCRPHSQVCGGLVALAPDVILATGSASVGPLLQATRAIPIVFVVVPDPVAAGFVDSLARPGGNATGFINFEHGIGAKWLEVLKEIAPGVRRDHTSIKGPGRRGTARPPRLGGCGT